MATFNLEYIISLFIALLSSYFVHKGSPNLNPFITFFLVPFLVAYLTLIIINNVFPSINRFGRNVKYYVEDRTMGEINEMGYVQIFPPLFAIILLFFVLLYNRNLG